MGERSPASFELLGCRIGLDLLDHETGAAWETVYGPLAEDSAEVDLEYSLGRRSRDGVLGVRRVGGRSQSAENIGELLGLFDGDLSIELQKLRRELLFVHAGVVTIGGGAILLAGPPGAGKSTTCWGLSHYGFTYLSDELAPLELEPLRVQSFARALALKRSPPEGFPLPGAALATPGSFHVPCSALPGGSSRSAATPVGVVFLAGQKPGAPPTMRRVSHGEAAARLYANALNVLAHEDDGLAPAVELAAALPAYLLESGELAATCELLRSSLEPLAGG
jgi:hypothetical protein